jgi:uncharacterized protein with von Willebrand factor type A (vWA) domain
MDDRLIAFIRGLRAAGVRISVAESADALRAIETIGVANKDLFRLALRATLVKEAQDLETFEELFPQYFGRGAPPMPNQPGSGLSQADREKLADVLEQMLQSMSPEQLRQLFEAMMKGQQLSRQELQQMLRDYTTPSSMNSRHYLPWLTRRAMRELGFDRLDELLAELLEKLREAGLSDEALRQLAEEALENQRALGEQIGQEVGNEMRRRQAEEQRPQQAIDELMDRPFEYLSDLEKDELRGVISKLAAQLRSRAALRQRRGNRGTLDAKATIRANQRFAGVPLELHYRKRHLKPKLSVICDLSTSMRPVVSFMLLLVYALQDQISRTRSYAFIDDLIDISLDFAEDRPQEAIRSILERIRPGHYNTDLGNSLATFVRDQMSTVDHRTTVIILGDGRNNYNDPNLEAFEAIKRRARRVVWFNPESPRQWGTGDSDMLKYAPLCSAVHRVSNLRELVAAVDSLFMRR